MSAVKIEMRRFPLEEDFMKNKAVNSMLYAKLQKISYLNEDKERFVYDKDINFSSFADEMKIFSRQKLSRDFTMLKQLGFVTEGEEGDRKVFYLSYDSTKFFQLVPLLTIDYLLRVKSRDVVKVYVYLLNKFQWKKDYKFTVKELTELVGLAYTQQKNREGIEYILNSLHNEGLLEYKEVFIQLDNKNRVPIKNYQLVAVNTVVKGMEKKTEKKQKQFEKELKKELEEAKGKVDTSFYYNWMDEEVSNSTYNPLSCKGANGEFKF